MIRTRHFRCHLTRPVELHDDTKLNSLPSPQSYLPVVEAIEAELVDAVQDDDVFRLEDRKASNSWRALRIARMADIISFTDQVAGGRLDKYLEVSQSLRWHKLLVKLSILHSRFPRYVS